MDNNPGENLLLILALSTSLFFFSCPERFNRLIQFMLRMGKDFPIPGAFRNAMKPENWTARPFLVRLYFLPLIVILSWILYGIATGR